MMPMIPDALPAGARAIFRAAGNGTTDARCSKRVDFNPTI